MEVNLWWKHPQNPDIENHVGFRDIENYMGIPYIDCHSGLDPESRLVPAEAGNQKYLNEIILYHWIPASAGMTSNG